MLYKQKPQELAIREPTLYYVPRSNHSDLVRSAAYSATRKMGELTKEDYHDMLQEAQLAILKYAKDKHPAYQYKVARWATLSFYFRHILEGRAGQKRGGPWVEAHYPLNERLDIPAQDDLNAARLAKPRPLPIQGDRLARIFASSRSRSGRLTSRSMKAAWKDVHILQLLAAGHNNFGIAQEIGISPASVRACRMRIRRTLSKLAHAT